MADSHKLPTMDRRSVLKSTAGLGAVAGLGGLAGCIGDDDDVFSLTGGCSSRGSTSFEACQALQAVADRRSEILEFSATAPGGDPASIRALSEGEVDVRTAGNFISNQAYNNEGLFAEDPIDEPGGLVCSYITIDMYWLQLEEAGYESLDDAVDQGANIWGFPAGWGLRQLLETILSIGGRDDIPELFVDMAAEDVAGALEEGRIEVFAGYGNSGVGLAGWEVEVDARMDVEWLEAGEWFWDAVEESPALVNDIPEYGWEQSLNSPGEYRSWVDGFNMYAHPDVDDEAVYEILRLAHEYPGELRDVQPNWLDGGDLSQLTVGYWDHPVHSGAVQFWEDHDHPYEDFM